MISGSLENALGLRVLIVNKTHELMNALCNKACLVHMNAASNIAERRVACLCSMVCLCSVANTKRHHKVQRELLP